MLSTAAAVPALQSRLPNVGTTIFTVMSALAAEKGAVNLGQGFPDFDCDAVLVDAVTQAMKAGFNQYPPMTGVPALREAIAAKIAKIYGRQYDPATEITVTAGATQAILTTILCSVHPGDEVIVIEPVYDSYVPSIELAGGTPVFVQMEVGPQGYSVPWDKVAAAVSPRTRLIMINSPHNPSGAVLEAPDLETLAGIVRGTEIFVLSDEVYEHIIFDGLAHQSVLRHEELAARSIVVSSFGKTYHCTGWKVGYAVAPKALTAEFRKVHQYLTFCTFNPAQWAFAEFLESTPEHYLSLPAFYQAKRDRFRGLLAPSRLKLLDVPGGYFQLVDYAAIRDVDDINFSEWLVREGGVAAIPLSPFYESAPDTRLVRLCFAKNDATMEAAAELLCKL